MKRSQKSPIAAATAQKYAKERGLKAYMECSAKNQKVVDQIALKYTYLLTQFQGLKDVFDEAIKIVLNKDKETNRPSCCTLL